MGACNQACCRGGPRERKAPKLSASLLRFFLQGFIVAGGGGSGGGDLKICQMPIKVALETGWPLQKVAVRATAHRIAYYAEAKLYALLACRAVRGGVFSFSGPGGEGLFSTSGGEKGFCL
jgi:hypothetical protein